MTVKPSLVSIFRRARAPFAAASGAAYRLVALLLCLMALGLPKARAAAAPGLSASASIVVETSTGTVLFEKNADKQMLIASTTKILTGLVVLENCRVDDKVVIGADFPAVEGSSMYLRPGEELTVMELLYGLMLASGNDAAVALALHVSGSVAAFAELMNARALELGCTGSSFANPHGLDAKEHYSTARDLARITAAAMDNPTFEKIVSTRHISAAGRSLKNHNKLLWSCPGALGVKTGYTERAGRSLVSCAERDGMRLVCVTLSAPDDWNDHSGLYDWAFSAFKRVGVLKSDGLPGPVPVISGMRDNVAVRMTSEYNGVCASSDEVDISWQLPRFVYAPVAEGGPAGRIVITVNGQTEKVIPLVYADGAPLDEAVPLTAFEKFRRALTGGRSG